MAALKKAVVIDDEPDLTAFISSILEDNDFVVETANDAVTGEELVRTTAPDIVLIDLMMPGRSGVQLFIRLRRDHATSRIPVVMVTGIKEKMGIDWRETVDWLKVHKPDGFFEKPVDPDRLMAVIGEALAARTASGAARLD
ncbi:MAG: response regulator [Acidobacteriota bacterium]